jgi:oxygen-independent coproporphyrinogen-3 oxidase
MVEAIGRLGEAGCVYIISLAHLVDFDRYFAAERDDLRARRRRNGRARGRLDHGDAAPAPAGARGLCMVFDKYLRAAGERERCSRVV